MPSFICVLALTTIAGSSVDGREQATKAEGEFLFYFILFEFFFHEIGKMVGEIFGMQMMVSYKGKRPVIVDSDIVIQEEGTSSESVNNVCSCNGAPPPEEDSSDTSLKLGYTVFSFTLFFFFYITYAERVMVYNINISQILYYAHVTRFST